MARRIAKFHKVSYEQFKEGYEDSFGRKEDSEIQRIYELTLNPGDTVKVPTGIRVEMEPDWVLKCYPRSGLGFKYRLQLNNTVGIIDSDYFYSDNEGHIFAKITNDSKEKKTLRVEAGSGFMQGIFVEYGITVDDCVTTARNGGFGSTSKN